MSIENILRFEELGLAPAVLQAVEESGYETPSPIQVRCIPPLLAGRDVLGQAQTGTGKTAAFALPLLSRINLEIRRPQVLVLTPTRELAIQVAEAIQHYAMDLDGFHVLPVYGGQPIVTQLRLLKRGVQVVVGTPGRIIDHLERKTLRLESLQTVVLDEADEMLKMGFLDDVEKILESTPEQKQVALFSATMPAAVKRIANRHLHNPVDVHVEMPTVTVSTVRQRYCPVGRMAKIEVLTRILDANEFNAMLIFVRTKTATVELSERLQARGYASTALNGDMKQSLRERTIKRLKDGGLDIVVATDVAARGLDVERISHVVNYDIPYDTEAYVHRIGRTGRAGRSGEAILFILPREKRLLRSIEKMTGQTIECMAIPSAEHIADRRVTQFKQLITDTLESQELSFYGSLITEYQREHAVDPTELLGALTYLAQRQQPLQSEVSTIVGRPEQRGEGSGGFRGAERGGGGDAVAAERVCYRVEVGKVHGAAAKHLVGAIANEAGLEGRQIGPVKLFDAFSLVDLPSGMPKEIFKHLKRVYVQGRPLRITLCPGGGVGGGVGESGAAAGMALRPRTTGARPALAFKQGSKSSGKPGRAERKSKGGKSFSKQGKSTKGGGKAGPGGKFAAKGKVGTKGKSGGGKARARRV